MLLLLFILDSWPEYFTIADDTFNFDKQRVIDFCNLLIEKNLQIEWDCPQGIRADKLTPEIVKLMKKAGCKLLAMSIESVDTDVLKMIQKGETIDQIKAAIKAVNEAGIISKAFFLVGLPGDSVEKVLKSIKSAAISCFEYIAVQPRASACPIFRDARSPSSI